MARDKEVREFVKIWQEARTIDEIARKTGKSKRRCYSLASFYRKHGVPLKKFRAPPVDWESVAEYAKALTE